MISELAEWARAQLYGVREGGWRAEATTAVAASAAERTYRLLDDSPEWQNATSRSWRTNLEHVWEFVSGDQTQHYALSRAVAEYLLSPLNHNEGQDGPDDFDRPQTIAAYKAALSAIIWGVDFAVAAIRQIFEAIDLKYEGDVDSDERWGEVQHQIAFVREVVAAVIRSEKDSGLGLPSELLASIRR